MPVLIYSQAGPSATPLVKEARFTPGYAEEQAGFIGTTAALIMGGLAAAGSIGGAAMQSSAAQDAAGQQVSAEQQALDFQKQIWGQQQANQAPFLQAGQTSIGMLMDAIKSGKFGAGSLGAVPEAPGAFTDKFAAPTLEEARVTPGYQFTAQQGSKGILQGAAAAGGAISGGTLKALDQFNTGLADTTYNDVFNRALQTYGTGLSAYQANLQRYGAQLSGYQTGMAAQQQEFNQLYNPAALGEGSVQSLNQTGSTVAQNIGNIMGNIGNAQAAGTVGSANAWAGGLGGATNSMLQAYLMSKIFGGNAATGKASPYTPYTNEGVTLPG